MLIHNPDASGVMLLEEIDVFDVNADECDAPVDFDSAMFTFDPFVA
jgi:hypothetical protein